MNPISRCAARSAGVNPAPARGRPFVRGAILLILLCGAGLHAADSNEALPRPPAAMQVVEGTLPNGVRYALLPHRRDLGRVSLRLVVRAGSLDERNGEQGYAHFVEHLAYNATRHFPPGKLRAWLQSLGLAEGPDLNATTSFTNTTYKIDLPAGRSAHYVEALRVLRNFADGVEFSASEVQRERAVVLSELAARETDEAQVTRKHIAALYPGTGLPERFPSGIRADLERATVGSLRTFYRRCYAPERLTVIVTGDIDPELARRALAETFDSLRAAPGAAAQVLPKPVRNAGGLEAHVLTSANCIATNVVLVAIDERPTLTRAALRRALLRQLALDGINRRLGDRQARESHRFGLARAHGANGADGRFSQLTLEASASTDDWAGAVALLESELRRATTHGFTATEIQEYVDVRVAWARAAVDEIAGQRPDEIATAITEAAAVGAPWLHPATTAALAEEFAPTIAATEVTAQLRTMFAEERIRLVMTRRAEPAGGNAAVVAAWRESAARATLPAPAPAVPLEFRYAAAATPGAVASRRTEADLGIELVAFANGARLNLRRSDTEPGRFRLAARLGRGVTDFPRDRPGLPHIAAHLLKETDLGRHTRREVERLLRRRALASYATFDHRFLVEIHGPVAELPFALQLLAAAFSDAKLDPNRFQEAVSDTAGCREAQLDDASSHAREGIIALMSGGDPRLREPPPYSVGNYTFAEVSTWLRRHWLEGPLEVAITGDFDAPGVVTDAARTVGTLGRLREPSPETPDRPTLRKDSAHESRNEPLADTAAAVRLAWPVATTAPESRHALKLATDVLVDRLHHTLRQELGATYTPEGSILGLSLQHDFAFASVALTLESARAPELTRRALALADELARGGITANEFARLREPLRAAAAENQRSNTWWLNEVLARAQSDPSALADARASSGAFEQISRADVNRAAAEHFRSDRASSLLIVPVPPAAAPAETEPATAADFVGRAVARLNRGDLDGAFADFDRALAVDPNCEDAYVNRAVARMARQDLDGVIADCTRALDLNPKNAQAYTNRAGAKMFLGAIDAAIADCNKAIELDPTLALAYANRAGGRLIRGDFPGATADATRAIELDPKNATAYVNRGAASANQGDAARAIADFTQATELDPRNADAYSNRGYLRQQAGNLDGALADYDRAIELSPAAVSAHRNRGMIHQARGRNAAALADFDKVISVAPDDEVARLGRGIVRQQAGDLEGALGDIEHVIRINPKNADAFNNRGYVRQLKRDLDGAIADYTTAIGLRPDFALPHTNRGHARRLKGDTSGAMEDLDRGAQLAAPTRPSPPTQAPKAAAPAQAQTAPPPEVQALLREGNARRGRRDYDGAIEQYSAAITLEPTNAAAYLGSGYAHDAKRNYRASFADFDRVIQLNPKSAEAHNGRGYARNAQGSYAAALADYTRAVQLNPRYAPVYHNRGTTKRILGDFAGSIVDLDAAIGLSPGYSTAYYQRAITRQAMGEPAAAIADYDRYIARSPGATYAQILRFLCLAPADREKERSAFATVVAAWPQGWPKPLGRYLAGEIDATALRAYATQGATNRTANSRPCEAEYAIGMVERAAGNLAKAREHFAKSTARELPGVISFTLARAELARLAGGE